MNDLLDTLIRFEENIKMASLYFYDGFYEITIKKTPEKYPETAFVFEWIEDDEEEKNSHECQSIYEVYNHIVDLVMEPFHLEFLYYGKPKK